MPDVSQEGLRFVEGISRSSRISLLRRLLSVLHFLLLDDLMPTMRDVTSVNLNISLGALFIGQVVSTALWGCSTLQVFYYFDSYPEDKLQLKLLVLSVWILDTAHQGCVVTLVYKYCISHFGDFVFIQHMPYALWFMLLFSAAIAIVVQSFLVYRVYILSGRKIILAIIAELFVIEQCLALISLCVVAYHDDKYSDLFKNNVAPLVITIASASSDVVIAACMVYFLHRSATRGPHALMAATETIVRRLILFVINSSVLTTTCMLLSLITFLALPNDLIYLAFYIIVSKLYANTLYATLNFRIRARRPSSSILSTRRRSESVASTLSPFHVYPHATAAVHRLSMFPPSSALSCDGKRCSPSQTVDCVQSDGDASESDQKSVIVSNRTVADIDSKKSNDSAETISECQIESVPLPTVSQNFNGDGDDEFGTHMAPMTIHVKFEPC